MTNNFLVRNVKENLLQNLNTSILHIEPEDYILSQYEENCFPGIIGGLTGISVSKVYPKYRLGRVYSFDILPAGEPDPIIVYCPQGDLRPYYKIWVDVVMNGIGIDLFGVRKMKLRKYDEAIRHFLRTCRLTNEEMVFAVTEMLKFKNKEMLPGSTPLELSERFKEF